MWLCHRYYHHARAAADSAGSYRLCFCRWIRYLCQTTTTADKGPVRVSLVHGTGTRWRDDTLDPVEQHLRFPMFSKEARLDCNLGGLEGS